MSLQLSPGTTLPIVTTLSDDTLSPPLSLLAKLGAIVVQAGECFSRPGINYDDVLTLRKLLIDPEVVQGLEDMRPLVPVKRNR
mgnify:FL=1